MSFINDPWVVGWLMGTLWGGGWIFFTLYRPLQKKYFKLLEKK